MNEPRARAVPDGFPWRAALLLGLVAVVLRIGTGLSRIDEHSQEAFVRGVLAQAWIEDAPVWPSHAPQIQHLRGSVVVSALAVPCFALLGPTTFALRLPGLLFHVAGMLLLMLLVHRHTGRRAAMLAGALWVLAPPALAKIAVYPCGDRLLLEVLRGLPAPLGRDVACGLGAGYRLRFLDPPPADLDSPTVARLVSLLAEAAPELEEPFRAGLGATTAEVASASDGDLR